MCDETQESGFEWHPLVETQAPPDPTCLIGVCHIRCSTEFRDRHRPPPGVPSRFRLRLPDTREATVSADTNKRPTPISVTRGSRGGARSSVRDSCIAGLHAQAGRPPSTRRRPTRPALRDESRPHGVRREALRLYPRHSREELGGRFLGHPALPERESVRGPEHAGKAVDVSEAFRDVVPQDPRDMAKAGLLETQSPAVRVRTRRNDA